MQVYSVSTPKLGTGTPSFRRIAVMTSIPYRCVLTTASYPPSRMAESIREAYSELARYTGERGKVSLHSSPAR